MKERLITTAAVEMNKRGVKFTIDSLAEQLGISKKTVYQYVASKQELIHLVVATALRDMTEQMNDIAGRDLSLNDRLYAVLTVQPKCFGPINDWVYDDLKRYCPAEWQIVEQYSQKKLKVLSEIIDQGIASGKLRPVNTPVVVIALNGAIKQLLEYRFLSENNLTFNDALVALTDIIMYGIVQKAGN